jgi:ribonucleoside-diphosphate reductase alpha chain
MDYIFRWLQLRFLSGQQLSLFAGLAAPPSTLSQDVILSEAKNLYEGASGFTADQHNPTRGMGATAAPLGGILPEIGGGSGATHPHAIEDRGIYHASDAMRDMYDMGDAPSCHTCGAIMVRNGSCYRCMSCGSTSGCS